MPVVSHLRRAGVTGATIVKETVTSFIEDDAMRLSAALSFYMVLSLAPLTVVVLAVANFVWGDAPAQQELVRWVDNLFGAGAATVVAEVVRQSTATEYRGLAAVLAIGALLFGATTAFHNLQDAMNKIWNVAAPPGRAVRGFLRKRLISLVMIIILGLLLVASVIVTSLLAGFRDLLPAPVNWQLVNLFASLVVFTAGFAVMFKVLPDADIHWREVGLGAAVTALLFVIGKELAAMYLATAGAGSAYGAAGSLFVLLLWIYYSSIMLFLGAEFTQTAACHLGHGIEPRRRRRRVSMKVA